MAVSYGEAVKMLQEEAQFHRAEMKSRTEQVPLQVGVIAAGLQGSITLDTRNPTSVEKMLKFLYTGNPKVNNKTAEVQITPGDSDIVPGSYKALRVSQTDQDAMEKLPARGFSRHLSCRELLWSQRLLYPSTFEVKI
ncbi:hypothetical protein PDE_05936 [Penicillium oxalicum 114-2]|uniref:Uncharacterized protein n=1 Tax=Penicillium oxalicum (strain 114-2 / CGMCC 5302) TaxID=933388 RepID=S8B8B9_PENO1|nr:hypothetical protein PDE_05936 [Penicillium oxalicum 114-2]